MEDLPSGVRPARFGARRPAGRCGHGFIAHLSADGRNAFALRRVCPGRGAVDDGANQWPSGLRQRLCLRRSRRAAGRPEGADATVPLAQGDRRKSRPTARRERKTRSPDAPGWAATARRASLRFSLDLQTAGERHLSRRLAAGVGQSPRDRTSARKWKATGASSSGNRRISVS